MGGAVWLAKPKNKLDKDCSQHTCMCTSCRYIARIRKRTRHCVVIGCALGQLKASACGGRVIGCPPRWASLTVRWSGQNCATYSNTHYWQVGRSIANQEDKNAAAFYSVMEHTVKSRPLAALVDKPQAQIMCQKPGKTLIPIDKPQLCFVYVVKCVNEVCSQRWRI